MKEKNDTNLAGKRITMGEVFNGDDHELRIKEMFEKFTSNKIQIPKEEK